MAFRRPLQFSSVDRTVHETTWFLSGIDSYAPEIPRRGIFERVPPAEGAIEGKTQSIYLLFYLSGIGHNPLKSSRRAGRGILGRPDQSLENWPIRNGNYVNGLIFHALMEDTVLRIIDKKLVVLTYRNGHVHLTDVVSLLILLVRSIARVINACAPLIP